MAAQRPASLAPAIRATAGRLPLRDASVDAAMAVLTLHHWDHEQERGIRELRRVARGPVVLLTIDPRVSGATWLLADYLPEVAALDREIFPPPETLADWLGGAVAIDVLEVPRDTPDQTLLSFWAHPERVLDAEARAATSGFARMQPAIVDRCVAAVERDLASGAWDARHGHLRDARRLRRRAAARRRAPRRLRARAPGARVPAVRAAASRPAPARRAGGAGTARRRSTGTARPCCAGSARSWSGRSWDRRRSAPRR